MCDQLILDNLQQNKYCSCSHHLPFRQSISCWIHQTIIMTMKFRRFVIVISTIIVIKSVSTQQASNPFIPSSDSKTAQLLSPLSIPLQHPSTHLGGAIFLPEDSVPAVGPRQQLLRRFHYLQYIKAIYRQLKEEYTRLYTYLHILMDLHYTLQILL